MDMKSVIAYFAEAKPGHFEKFKIKSALSELYDSEQKIEDQEPSCIVAMMIDYFEEEFIDLQKFDEDSLKAYIDRLLVMNICTASINEEVLTQNLEASAITKRYPVGVMRGFNNVAKAYNLHLDNNTLTDIIIFVHDDVFIPEGFEKELQEALAKLPKDWAVIGVAGASPLADLKSRLFRGHVKDRGREWGKFLIDPIEVQTLDELMIIVNMKHGLKFDEQFPLDFYGADICLQAHEAGLGVYAIEAFVHHNSSRAFGGRTPGFFESEKKLRDKWWKKHLAIATTCTLIK